MSNDQNKQTKYCQNCGAEIDARAEVCPNCGVRVGYPQQANTDEMVENYNKMYSKTVKHSLKIMIPVILGTMLVVFLLIWFILPTLIF
ncbi:MAG: zinc ribbon domain-containing protein [Candidatus Aenigmatarchaeota archaeon]